MRLSPKRMLLLIFFLMALLFYPETTQAQALNGFLETRLGTRIHRDANQKKTSLGETRLQLEVEQELEAVSFRGVADFIADAVSDENQIDLDTGEGLIDLRELHLSFSLGDNIDLKIGRQMLTWGTGDLLFINDLFAKDWNAFLMGRDNRYLKAPSDAIKSSFFHSLFNLDIVYLPRFRADRFIDGKRHSFFDRSTGSLRGRNNPLSVEKSDSAFQEDELALRLYRILESLEVALYYYQGYWKSPAGEDRQTGKAIFPRLKVLGSSVRGLLFSGIAHAEVGFYQSADAATSDPLIRNSEARFLLGYAQEIAPELSAALQYYLEQKQDYSAYKRSLPAGAIIDDKNRQVLTLRLTQWLQQQNLMLSLFQFYSPSDEDGHLRLRASYKWSDALKIEGGGNAFFGENQHSFYAQFEKSSTLFAAIRYSF